jgi:5-methylcytosine-specific restriction endonuclease McrA
MGARVRHHRLGSDQHRSKLRRLINRDGLVCWVCGEAIDPDAPLNAPGQVSIDHVVPRRLGGRHELSNLKLAHKACNEQRDREDRRRCDPPWAVDSGALARGRRELSIKPANGSPAPARA